MAVSWEMVNCGNCRRCLTAPGVKLHGPYRYSHAWNGGNKRHLYGGGRGGEEGGGASGGRVVLGDFEELPEAEKKRMRREANREYRETVQNLTPEEKEKLEEVVRLRRKLDSLSRRELRERKRREKEVVEDMGTDGSGEAGLAALALEHIAAEVAEQFAAEKKELKKQLEREKKEWKKMLAANKPKKPPKD